jgi:antibiotic biosynthesis monooxygenase (ABM) superfamily enzyme
MTSASRAQASIGVVVTCRVQAAQAAAFEEGLGELMRAAAAVPGRVSADVLRGTAGPGGQEYYLVYRFVDEPSLRAWEASPQRQALVARLAPLFREAGRRELTGMEAWFDLPSGAPAPARWRMAVLTWLGIWPLVSLSLYLLAPHLAGLPFLLQTAVNSALLVLAMTYLVMPGLVRIAAPWLTRVDESGGQGE